MSNRPGYIISDQYAAHYMTFTIVGWVDVFTRRACRDIVIESLKYCQSNKGLIVYAYVIMDSHMHIIARAKEDSIGLSAILRDFKKYTSVTLLNWLLKSKKESRKEWLAIVFQFHARQNKNNTRFQLWQQSNHPKVLLYPKFIQQKLRYIHNNPVEAGIVDLPADYIYSSARNYIDRADFVLEVERIDFGVEEGFTN